MSTLDTPLYILAEQKNLPDNQYLDSATLEWIADQGAKMNIYFSSKDRTSLSSIIDKLEASYGQIIKISLADDYYARGELARGTIHGDLHIYRVAIFASLLADASSCENAFIAGLYHDIARFNDKADDGHGVRSAERVIKLGLLSGVPNQQVVIDAISCHEESFIDEGKNLLALVIKTADALDRYRLPKLNWWPDPDRMQYVPDRILFKVAYWMVLYSETEYIKTANACLSIRSALLKIREQINI